MTTENPAMTGSEDNQPQSVSADATGEILDIPVSNSDTDSSLQNKLLRLQADFDNFRRRNVSARQEARDETRRELLSDLLPVYDNFLRALQHSAETGEDSAMLSGLEGIRMQLEEVLKRQGLEEIDASEGSEFDPHLHEATGTIAGNEEQADTIAQELQKGFVHKGQVIRPAQVLVYQLKAEE